MHSHFCHFVQFGLSMTCLRNAYIYGRWFFLTKAGSLRTRKKSLYLESGGAQQYKYTQKWSYSSNNKSTYIQNQKVYKYVTSIRTPQSTLQHDTLARVLCKMRRNTICICNGAYFLLGQESKDLWSFLADSQLVDL